GDLRDDRLAPAERSRKLEDLGFARDRSERAVHHPHSAGYTFVIVDERSAVLVRHNGIHAACLLAGALFLGDRIIGTDRFALAALDAFFLIDKRFPVHHGDRAPGTDLLAGMCQTALAYIADLIFILLAALARRGDDLHQRRLIIFLGNIARLHARGQMDRLVLRTEGQAHCQAEPLPYDGAGAI